MELSPFHNTLTNSGQLEEHNSWYHHHFPAVRQGLSLLTLSGKVSKTFCFACVLLFHGRRFCVRFLVYRNFVTVLNSIIFLTIFWEHLFLTLFNFFIAQYALLLFLFHGAHFQFITSTLSWYLVHNDKNHELFFTLSLFTKQTLLTVYLFFFLINGPLALDGSS